MLQTQKVFRYELPIKIEPQKEGGYVAICPKWLDCYAQGETIDEVVTEIAIVAKALIGIYKEENLKIPLKTTSKGDIENITMPIIVAA